MPAPSTESKKQTPLNGDSGPKSPAQICCSKEYYMPDGDVWALVEESDTYCRFHSYWTRNATNFYESFLEPGKKLEKDALPGTGPEKAIIIRNATIQEFERFLWVFYNKKYDDYSEASLEDWFTILRLSHEWGYEDVKAMALRYIKGRAEEIPDLVDRIVLYEKYSLPSDTILPMYMTLCTREEFPTDTECSKLGDTRALQIHRARERLLKTFKGAKITVDSDKKDKVKAKEIIVEALSLKNGVVPPPPAKPAASAPSMQAFSSNPTPGAAGSNSADTTKPCTHNSDALNGLADPKSVAFGPNYKPGRFS